MAEFAGRRITPQDTAPASPPQFKGRIVEGGDSAPQFATTGAPLGVRALVGGAPTDAARLETIRRSFPDAEPTGDGNFVFTDPQTGQRTLYNPPGFDAGDVASLTREAAQGVGGTIGAGVGTALGPAGTLAGAGLGTAAGEELFNLGAQQFGMADDRNLLQRAGTAGEMVATGTGGQAGGAAVGAGLSAGFRGLMRGGKAGRQGMQEALENFDLVGADPSLGQATKRRAYDSIEGILAKAPGGSGRIAKVAQNTIDRVDEFVKRRAPFAGADAEKAGRTVERGIEGFTARFKDQADALYNRVDNFIPQDAPIRMDNTARVMTEIMAPIPGAPNVSQALSTPGVKALSQAFFADAAEGAIPYQAASVMRSAVGRKLGSVDLVSDIPKADLKRIYGAISQDLEAAAAQRGPEALAAFRRANSFYRAGIDRIDGVLEPLVKKQVPEKIFKALESGTRDGPTQIRAVMKSLTDDERQVVQSAVMRRLGRATPGQQDAAGEAFSLNTFLTNWNKIDASAKDAIFTGGMRRDMDRIAGIAQTVRENQKAFANPSGTAGNLTGQTLMLVGGGSGIAGAATGNVSLKALPAVMAVGALGANGTARLMTNRGFVRWLAQATKIRPNGMGAHIGRLSAVAANADPGTRQAIREYLSVFTPNPVQ